ncbi:MAG: type II toxin-antitoxin system Phd/YefM family antitoxin [Paracoccaceae bacterium]
MTLNPSQYISTTYAREQLSRLIRHVQDPRTSVVLTRHGQPVAALVSMTELERIWALHDVEEVRNGKIRLPWTTGKDGMPLSLREEAEKVLKVQMDRKKERDLLARFGMDPLPGGELMTDVDPAVVEEEEEVVETRRGFWGWLEPLMGTFTKLKTKTN